MTRKQLSGFTAIGLAAALLAIPGTLLAQDEGYVKASGKPGNAGVFVDGKYLGPASRFSVTEKYAVPAGELTITLRDPRYEDFETRVTVRPGQTAKVDYQMKPAEPAQPPYGRLRFKGGVPESFMSVASGDTSAVFLNGKFFGYVDELNNPGGGLLLPPGTYRLRVSSPIYGEIDRDVTIQANQVTAIPLAGRES